MNKILLLLMTLLSLQVYAGTASMDEQEKKPVNIEVVKHIVIHAKDGCVELYLMVRQHVV